MESPDTYLRSRLKLRQLAVLIAIARAGSLRKASVALGVSQPALSKTLRELESVYGRTLFLRDARGLRPTPHGTAVIEFAGRSLRDMDNLAATLDAVDSGEGGRVRMGVIPFLSIDWLLGMLERLRAGRPRILAQVAEGGTDLLVEWLRRRELDCVIGRITPSLAGEDLEARPMFDQALRVVARSSHPLVANGRRPGLKDLLDSEWILPARNTPTRQAIDRVFVAAGLSTPRAYLESYSLQIFQRLLMSGDTLAAIPEDTAQSWIRAGGLRALAFSWALPTICLVWRKPETATPMIRRVCEAAGLPAHS